MTTYGAGSYGSGTFGAPGGGGGGGGGTYGSGIYGGGTFGMFGGTNGGNGNGGVDPGTGGDVDAITAPLYDQVFRINLRDGVWYEGDGANVVTGNAGALGNLPLAWDEDTQTWVPGSYSPQEWQDEKWEQVPQ